MTHRSDRRQKQSTERTTTILSDQSGHEADPLVSRHVVIIGGGYGGLACAIELGNAPEIDVTVVDRRNPTTGILLSARMISKAQSNG